MTKSSTYRGVTFEHQTCKWRTQISVGGRTRFIGRFNTEIEAAKAADNVRLFLREFFPDPFNARKLNFQLKELELLIAPETEVLKAALIAEGAPTHHHVMRHHSLAPVAQRRAFLIRQLMDTQREARAAGAKASELLKALELLESEPEPAPVVEEVKTPRVPGTLTLLPSRLPPEPEAPPAPSDATTNLLRTNSGLLNDESNRMEEREPDRREEDPGPD